MTIHRLNPVLIALVPWVFFGLVVWAWTCVPQNSPRSPSTCGTCAPSPAEPAAGILDLDQPASPPAQAGASDRGRPFCDRPATSPPTAAGRLETNWPCARAEIDAPKGEALDTPARDGVRPACTPKCPAGPESGGYIASRPALIAYRAGVLPDTEHPLPSPPTSAAQIPATQTHISAGTQPIQSSGGLVSDITEEQQAGTDRAAAGMRTVGLGFAPTKQGGGPAAAALYRVSAYCNCFICTGKQPGDKDYGITKSGKAAAVGTIAADPKVLSRGSVVDVLGYGRGTVMDIGDRIKGKRLDIWFPTHAAALNFGVKWLNVTVLK